MSNVSKVINSILPFAHGYAVLHLPFISLDGFQQEWVETTILQMSKLNFKSL